jgi:SAM-dependent methyltransferase
MDTRTPGYALLRGHGLEIGALHQPAKIPEHCTIEYCDAITREQAIRIFHEIPAEYFVNPTYLCDLDQGELRQFVDQQFDFVILCHVIEHVANPINVIGELFRIVKPGGHVVIACPDKRYTFDKDRDLTSFMHLVLEYHQQVDTVTDEHYRDYLAGAHPHILELPESDIAIHLASVRNRREHAHVWDSNSFRAFLVATLSMFNENASCIYESFAYDNQFEYFGVWRREPPAAINQVVGSQGELLRDMNQRVCDLGEQIQAQTQHIRALEATIATKNQHIVQLEALIKKIESGRIMQVLNRLRQLRR